jgi:hypothetical protein
MTYFRNRFLTVAEAWYSADQTVKGADVAYFYTVPIPVVKAHVEAFQTIWIDLTLTEPELLSGMKKNTRSEIRRASSEALRHQVLRKPSASEVRSFIQFFERNTISRQLSRELRRWTSGHHRGGSLALSRVSLEESTLAWHAYYVDGAHARLKYSVSLSRQTDGGMRNLIGRAHRFQHWEDIKSFKADGFSVYDLGGWAHNSDDEKLLGINQFKEGFGGQFFKGYNCKMAVTVKGKCYLWMADCYKYFVAQSRKKDARRPTEMTAGSVQGR